jgi:hypothetical protein
VQIVDMIGLAGFMPLPGIMSISLATRPLLILDIDETLIHGREEPLNSSGGYYIMNVHTSISFCNPLVSYMI